MTSTLKKFLALSVVEDVKPALEEAAAEVVVDQAPVEQPKDLPEEIAVVLEEPAAVPALTDGETKLDVVEAPEATVVEVVAEVAEVTIEPVVVATEEAGETTETAAEETNEADVDVGEIVVAEIKSDEIQRDLETLVEAQTAMEAYGDLLTQALEDGGINAQSAAFLRIGMERYEFMFGFEQPLTPSVEAFGGSMSQRKATQVSLEAIEDVLKSAWETIKKALEALWTAIQDYYSKLQLGVGATEKKIAATEKKAVELKGATASAHGIMVSNPGKLMADGKWLGDKAGISELEKLVDYVTETYPKAAQAFAADLASSLSEVDIKGLISSGKGEVSDLLKSDLEAIRKGFPGKADKDGVAETELLFGNKVLCMDTSSVSKLTFAVADGQGKAAPSNHQLDVASVAELEGQLKALNGIVGKLGKLSENKAAAKKAVDGLIKAGDALKKKLDEAEVPEFTRKRGQVVLREVLSVQKMLGTSYNGVLSYLMSVINAQVAVINQQLSVYKAETKGDEK